MTPEILGPAILAGCALLSFIVGYYATPTRVRVVPHRYIPPELSRLASALGITEDIPTSDSYGRRIHDLFEERDMVADNLRAEIRDLQEELEKANAELVRQHNEPPEVWGENMIRNPDVSLPAKWWVTYDEGLAALQAEAEAEAEAEIVRRRNDLSNVWAKTFANPLTFTWTNAGATVQAAEDSPQREITGGAGDYDETMASLSGWTRSGPTEVELPTWCCSQTATGEGYRDVTYQNTKTGKSWTLRTPADTPTETLLAMRDLAGWTRTSEHWGQGVADVYWVNPETQDLCHYPMGHAANSSVLGTVSGLAPGYYYAPVQA